MIEDAGSDVSIMPAVSSQKVRVCIASETVKTASSATASGTTPGLPGSAPSGRRPMSSGRLRTVNQASGAIAQTRNAISTQPRRQLAASAICATTGATRMPAVRRAEREHHEGERPAPHEPVGDRGARTEHPEPGRAHPEQGPGQVVLPRRLHQGEHYQCAPADDGAEGHQLARAVPVDHRPEPHRDHPADQTADGEHADQ